MPPCRLRRFPRSLALSLSLRSMSAPLAACISFQTPKVCPIAYWDVSKQETALSRTVWAIEMWLTWHMKTVARRKAFNLPLLCRRPSLPGRRVRHVWMSRWVNRRNLQRLECERSQRAKTRCYSSQKKMIKSAPGKGRSCGGGGGSIVFHTDMKILTKASFKPFEYFSLSYVCVSVCVWRQ